MKKLVFSIFSFFLFYHSVEAQDDSHNNWNPNFESNMTIDFISCTVSNMPLHVRDVPIHPDDIAYYGTSEQGPIAQLGYSFNYSFDINIFFLSKLSSSIFLGIGINLTSVGISQDNDKSLGERNYTNAVGTDQRGYGAALTYVQIYEGGLINIKNESGQGNSNASFISPTIRLEDKLSESLTFGISINYLTIQAENGWDRYNALQAWNTYTLSYVFPVKLYFDWHTVDYPIQIGIIGGVQFNPNIQTDTGSGIGLSIPPAFFAGMSFAI